MNRRSIPELSADLEDLVLRCKDAGVEQETLAALQRARLGLYLEEAKQLREAEAFPEERPSYAPNAATRRTATEHFRKAKEYTSEALRRLRRDQ
jgi:hypothetical protein